MEDTASADRYDEVTNDCPFCNPLNDPHQHILTENDTCLLRHHDEPYAGRGLRYWLKQPENRRWKSPQV